LCIVLPKQGYLSKKKLSKFKAKEVTVFISLTLVTAKLDLGEEKMKENQQFKEQDFARNTKPKKKKTSIINITKVHLLYHI
jgi:hypothetical protein